jgi:hypothetical protein
MTASTEMITVYLSPADAVKRIKSLARDRRQPFLHCEQRAIIRDDVNSYFPIMGNVKVSVAVAVEFVESAYRGFEDRGAQVRIVYCDNCVFIG